MTEIEPPAIESFRRRERWPEISDAAVERVRGGVLVIDEALKDQEYLVRDRFTVADIVASEVVRVAARVRALEPRGRLAEYLSAMEGRPARQRAAAKLA